MGSALGLVHLTATLSEVRGHGVSARTCSSHGYTVRGQGSWGQR